MEPPWDGGTKVCLGVGGLGHMTKMAAMGLYTCIESLKNIYKSTSEIFLTLATNGAK